MNLNEVKFEDVDWIHSLGTRFLQELFVFQTAAEALRGCRYALYIPVFIRLLSIMVLVTPIVEFRKTVSMTLSYEPKMM
jgi:hypothetical protein